MVYKIVTIYEGRDGQREAVSLFDTPAQFQKAKSRIEGMAGVIAAAFYQKFSRDGEWRRLHWYSGEIGFDWSAYDARGSASPQAGRQPDRQPQYRGAKMVRNTTRARIKRVGKRPG